jgi:amidase
MNVETLGFFARSVEDLQLVTDMFALQDNEVPVEKPSEALFAMMETLLWHLAESGTRNAMIEAASILTLHGVKVDEVSFPSDYSDGKVLKRMVSLIADGEARTAFLKEYWMGKTKVAKEISDLVEIKFNYTKHTRACDQFLMTWLPNTMQPLRQAFLISRRSELTGFAIRHSIFCGQ